MLRHCNHEMSKMMIWIMMMVVIMMTDSDMVKILIALTLFLHFCHSFDKSRKGAFF